MNINAHFFLFYNIPGVQFYIKNPFCLFAHYTFVRYFARWNLLKFVVSLKHFGCEFLYGEPFCCLYRCFSIHIKMCILLWYSATKWVQTLCCIRQNRQYFATEFLKIWLFKTFWVRIFARITLLSFRCFSIQVKPIFHLAIFFARTHKMQMFVH